MRNLILACLSGIILYTSCTKKKEEPLITVSIQPEVPIGYLNNSLYFKIVGGGKDSTYTWDFGDGTGPKYTKKVPYIAHNFYKSGVVDVKVTSAGVTGILKYRVLAGLYSFTIRNNSGFDLSGSYAMIGAGPYTTIDPHISFPNFKSGNWTDTVLVKPANENDLSQQSAINLKGNFYNPNMSSMTFSINFFMDQKPYHGDFVITPTTKALFRFTRKTGVYSEQVMTFPEAAVFNY